MVPDEESEPKGSVEGPWTNPVLLQGSLRRRAFHHRLRQGQSQTAKCREVPQQWFRQGQNRLPQHPEP